MENYQIKNRLKYLHASDLYLIDNPNLEKDVSTELGIVRYDYQGKSFEGRQCSKLLTFCYYLADLTPPECFVLICFFTIIRKVIAATFGRFSGP